ncbi:hypothetical protein [Teredinibacter turnerae]|uniref:hypothetical protein n=1 Tax=Teredinibacter turnerae TaxID=2426 RepID=UPI000491A0DA|nr:hypothetical protein [Teredinibacter turnerae]
MATKYEAWEDEGGIIFSDVQQIQNLKDQNLFDGEMKLLHVVYADTPEEAMAVHHIKMGWEPFRPNGEAALCPNGCGSQFYPKDSGQCPSCGSVC